MELHLHFRIFSDIVVLNQAQETLLLELQFVKRLYGNQQTNISPCKFRLIQKFSLFSLSDPEASTLLVTVIARHMQCNLTSNKLGLRESFQRSGLGIKHCSRQIQGVSRWKCKLSEVYKAIKFLAKSERSRCGPFQSQMSAKYKRTCAKISSCFHVQLKTLSAEVMIFDLMTHESVTVNGKSL